MQRDPQSHKGENGKVAVVGGSRYQHGAPIFSALGAEATGVNLLYLTLPACHEEAAKSASHNVQVYPFAGNDLRSTDVRGILELLATVDAAVIGPGLERDAETIAALREVITGAACALVLDATALQPWTCEVIRGRLAVLTPHAGELERMGMKFEMACEQAKQRGVTVVCKGAIDRICCRDGTTCEISGGNAGLTVGGTGDVLAGLIAGFLAQRCTPEEAAQLASRTIKAAGDELGAERSYAYTATDVLAKIPFLLRDAWTSPRSPASAPKKK